jgi:hypothetical protein
MLDILRDRRRWLAPPPRALPRTECSRVRLRQVAGRFARLRSGAIADWHQVNPP